jgi:DNA-binding MarR family transcriptional regulator
MGRLVVSSMAERMWRSTGLAISPSTLPMLRELKGTSLRLGQLADFLGFAQPTVTARVQDLERRGLISRSRDQSDRRSIVLQLTEKGNQALEMFDRLRDADFTQILAEWNEQDVATFARLLAQFAQGMRSLLETREAETMESPALDT